MSAEPNAAAPVALLITGPVGAGKTTTAEAIGTRLRGDGIAHAVIDLDSLGQLWPSPIDDRFNLAVELENLRAVAANYRRAGARRLVLAGVVETDEAGRLYAAALGVPVVVCRLVVTAEEVRRRLLERHPPGQERDWHLARSLELTRVLSENEVGDAAVEVGADPVDVVAEQVMRVAGW